LFGNDGTDIEDALKRLGILTYEEVQVAAVQVLKSTLSVDNRVAGVLDQVRDIGGRISASTKR
jgi:hypothetical protein